MMPSAARLAAFILIAFGYSWAWWLPLAAAGRPVGFGEAAPVYLAGIPGPLVAAIVVTAATEGAAGLRDLFARVVRLRVAARWYVVAFLVPVALLIAALAITVAAGGSAPAPASFGVVPGLPAMAVPVVWLYAVLWNGLGEETGWRGFALPMLQRRLPPLAATIVLSVIWAAWHLPLLPVLTSFEVVSRPAMLPAFWFGLACLSIVLTWLYHRSGSSIFVVALWHGTYNVVAGTAGVQNGVNVVFTVGIMLWAVWLVGLDVYARRTERARPPFAANDPRGTST